MPSLLQPLLLVRAWFERNSETPLRVSIRHTTDVPNELGPTTTVTSPEAGGRAVQSWLEEVVEAHRLDEANEAERR